MSVHQCPECGHVSHLFGEGGGARVAAQLGVPLLAELPLALSIREQADGGKPTVRAEPDSAISATYRRAARHMAARLWHGEQAAPTINMVDD
jgi:ATP-binding protein involved in chromosome partitioning